MKLRYFKISIAVVSVKICGDCFIYFYDNIFIPKDVNTRQGSASSFPSGIYWILHKKNVIFCIACLLDIPKLL